VKSLSSVMFDASFCGLGIGSLPLNSALTQFADEFSGGEAGK